MGTHQFIKDTIREGYVVPFKIIPPSMVFFSEIINPHVRMPFLLTSLFHSY